LTARHQMQTQQQQQAAFFSHKDGQDVAVTQSPPGFSLCSATENRDDPGQVT